MSIELGKLSKPLKLRYVGDISITKVYGGDNYLWPERPPQIGDTIVNIPGIDVLQLRFIWGKNDGTDLDSSCAYINSPLKELNGRKVGFGYPRVDCVAPVLYWGGDNISSGAECSVFDLRKIKELYKDNLPKVLEMSVCLNWYGTAIDGNVLMEISSFKGGTVVRAYGVTANLNDNIDINGKYIFANADGSIDLYNSNTKQIEPCWVGQAVKVNDKYYKINMVDDSIEGLPPGLDISVQRVPINEEYVYDKGWLSNINTGKRYKIWNNQVNIAPDDIIIRGETGANKVETYINKLEPPMLVGADAERASISTVILNKDGNTSGVSRGLTSRNYAFVSGNSSPRDKFLLRVNIPGAPEGSSGSITSSNPCLAAKILYDTESDEVTVESVVQAGDIREKDIKFETT